MATEHHGIARQRDQERLELELIGAMDAGKALFSGRRAPVTNEPSAQ